MSSSSLIPLNLKSFHYGIISTFIQLIGPNIRLIIFHYNPFIFDKLRVYFYSCWFSLCTVSAHTIYACHSIILLFRTKYMRYLDFCSILTHGNASRDILYWQTRWEQQQQQNQYECSNIKYHSPDISLTNLISLLIFPGPDSLKMSLKLFLFVQANKSHYICFVCVMFRFFLLIFHLLLHAPYSPPLFIYLFFAFFLLTALVGTSKICFCIHRT